MFMYKTRWLLAGAATLGLAATPALAVDRTWLGINSPGEDGDPGSGNTGSTDVNDELSWDPIGDFAIPGAGDTAIFNWGISLDEAFRAPLIITGGAFNPDHIRLTANVHNMATENLLFHTDLTLETLEIITGNSTNVRGEVEVGDGVNPYTLTMTGERPFEFGGSLGGWRAIHLRADSTIEFAGDHIFDEFNSGNYHGFFNRNQGFEQLGGSGGIVAFTGVGATITLGDVGAHTLHPGSQVAHVLPVANHTLQVRSDQTWEALADAGAAIRLTGRSGEEIIQSIDGAPLHNLGQVHLDLYHSTQQDQTVFLPEMTLQSIELRGELTSGRRENYVLTGDVNLVGGTIIPGEFGQDEEPDTPSSQSDYSLAFNFPNVLGAEVRLDGHTLTLERGALLRKHAGGNQSNHPNMVALIQAQGSTLNIGGDLVIDDVPLPAGRTVEQDLWNPDPEGEEWLTAPDQETAEEDGYVFNEDLQEWGEFGFTTTVDVVSGEGRRVGVHGDIDTVINLAGNYTTNARSAAQRGNGLFESTVNLIGSGSTFEVAANAAHEIEAQTYAIGNLNVGTSSDAASIQLVNDFVNDGSIVTDEDGNETRLNDDEVLLTNNLSIAAGSTLDVNGQGVAVHGSLSIDATGTLDLNTGLTLNDEDIVTSFFGVGNQAAAWNAVASQVMDSSNPDAEFSAIFQNDNTYWQVGEATGPLLGDMNLDGVVDAVDVAPFVLALTNPGEYQNQHGIDPVLVGDINNDGALDAVDVQPFVQLLVGGGGAVAIPEPGSLALLGLGGLALLRRRRA